MSPIATDQDPSAGEAQLDPGGAEPAPDPATQYTLDSAAAALASGDVQRFYQDGARFEAVAQWLRSTADGLRRELLRLEQFWQGSGADAFSAAGERFSQRIDGMVEVLSAPSYAALMGELGDALAAAQRQIAELQTQRQQGRDAMAADPKAAADPAAQAAHQQQENALNEQAQRIMAQLSASYQQIGGQFQEFATRNSGAAQGASGAGGYATPLVGASAGGSGSGGATPVAAPAGAAAAGGAATPLTATTTGGVLGRGSGATAGESAAAGAAPNALMGGAGSGIVGKSGEKRTATQTELASVDPSMLALSQPQVSSLAGPALAPEAGRPISVPMSTSAAGPEDARTQKRTGLPTNVTTASAQAGDPAHAVAVEGGLANRPGSAATEALSPSAASRVSGGSTGFSGQGFSGQSMANPVLADDGFTSAPTANTPRGAQVAAAPPPGGSASPGGTPFMPPMGMGAGATNRERDRNTLNVEEPDTWDGGGMPTGVLGRD
ncbi:hypothetical protein [Saccharopolyspora sp. 5N708]|uniref:hypothetical protein n=1 Tax=Saccharopolyspora sp. 5N708 TaxID=3457424 RepID=UPI003FD64010